MRRDETVQAESSPCFGLVSNRLTGGLDPRGPAPE